jgi:hypothetical protein
VLHSLKQNKTLYHQTQLYYKVYSRMGYLHSLPNIIQMIKLKRMQWAGHAAQMEVKRNAVFWWGNLNETNYFRDAGING